MDTITATRRALHEVAQKDNLPFPLLDSKAEVFYPLLGEGQIRELVVMCGKQGPGTTGGVVYIFGHGPGN